MKAGAHQAASGSGLRRLLGDRSVAIGMGAAGIFLWGNLPYSPIFARTSN